MTKILNDQKHFENDQMTDNGQNIFFKKSVICQKTCDLQLRNV